VSNTNIPNVGDQFAQEQLQIQRELAKATRDLNGSIKQSIRGLQASFNSFVNPVTRLQDSITRLDQTNRAALALGTTTSKLEKTVSKNSDILQRGNVGYQKLVDAIVNNFEAGIRVQGGALGDLTEEMIATGQNVQGLREMNSDLLLFTGDNIRVMQDTNKANKDISDKYGVSNQKLIDSVNSLKQTFEEASFFGGETTASLEILTKELKARTGGKNVEGAIRTLLGLGTGGLGNLSTALRTGAGGLRSRISAGQAVSMGDIEPILAQVARIAMESGGGNLALGADIAAMRTGLSREQVVQLVNLNNQLTKSYALSEDQKKTNDELLNNIGNINDRARNFYDNTAVEMLSKLGTIDAALIGLAINASLGLGMAQGFKPTGGGGFKGALAGLGQIGGRLAFGATAGGAAFALNKLAPEEEGFAKSAMGVLEKAATGASLGAIVGGGIPGALIGGAGGLLFGIFESIMDSSKKTAEATQKSAQIEEDKRKEERLRLAAKEIERINFLTGYIRARTDLTLGKEIIPHLERLYKVNKQQAEEMRSSRTSASRTR